MSTATSQRPSPRAELLEGGELASRSLARLFKGSTIYALGGLANRLAALLLLPLFTSYMTPAEYGVVGMLAALAAFVTPLFSLGLGTSIGVAYFGSQDARERHSIIWAAGWIALASASLLVLAGWLWREPLGLLVLGEPAYATHIVIALAWAAAGVLAMPWQLALQFQERPLAAVAAATLGLAATLAASIWFVKGLGMGALGALAGSLFGQAALAVLAFAFSCGAPAWSGISGSVNALLRHGLPMIPSFFFLFILQQGVRWPLEWYHDLHAVGVYSVGAGLGGALGVLTAAFASAWTPFALGNAERQEAAAATFARITFWYVTAFGFLTCLFFLFAEPLVDLFAEAAFREATVAVGLSAASQFFLTLFALLLPPLYFAKRVQTVVLTQAAAAAIACLLALALIPPYGVLGAAATVALSTFALVFIQWAALRAMPVLHVRYDYLRGAVLLILFGVVGWASFHLSYFDPIMGFAQAGALSVLTAAAVGLVLLSLPRQRWNS